MPGGEFFPPVQYQPWWGLLGFLILILVIVVAWWIFVFASTRKSRVPAPPSTAAPRVPTSWACSTCTAQPAAQRHPRSMASTWVTSPCMRMNPIPFGALVLFEFYSIGGALGDLRGTRGSS